MKKSKDFLKYKLAELYIQNIFHMKKNYIIGGEEILDELHVKTSK
ncbi:hypothetical protein DFH46_001508 [Clostridium beijerinckii]|nr:hypothetical protein [Clostridium beijerinckii]NRV13957.1 hypothetical protein [Clostridium beijerinckii]